MKYLMVQFKVKPDKLAVCKKAIRDFVTGISKNEPDTFYYETFQMPDKLSFTHFMAFKNGRAEKKHRVTPHVKKFVEVLYPNCSKKPVFTALREIKTHRRAK